jgi:hypothetical protein
MTKHYVTCELCLEIIGHTEKPVDKFYCTKCMDKDKAKDWDKFFKAEVKKLKLKRKGVSL